MFSGLTASLQSEIDTIKGVLETHDRLRALLYSGESISTGSVSAVVREGPDSVHTVPQQASEAWMKLKEQQPNKAAWQIYDHCAAFTRLYALYEEFVVDLTSEFLKLLPSIYDSYHDLPEAVKVQHRLGAGQILLKLGKDGPYKDHDEKNIIQIFSQGFSGQRGYSLLEDAFFVDQQNYRSEIVAKIFSYLGVEECWGWVKNHPAVIEHMERERDEQDTPEKVLSDFIKNRNEAAHGSVDNIVALSDVLSIADFILAISKALAELAAKQVIKRQIELGQVERLGAVVHNFKGAIVGAKMNAVTIAAGDSVVIFAKQACYTAKIESIRSKSTPFDTIQLTEGQEIGLELSLRVKKGAEIYRHKKAQLVEPPQPEHQTVDVSDGQLHQQQPEREDAQADEGPLRDVPNAEAEVLKDEV
jgi:hypothetical protein